MARFRIPRFPRTRRFISRAAVITSLLIAIAMGYGWWWSQDRACGICRVGVDGGARTWDAGILDGRVFVDRGFGPWSDEPGFSTWVHDPFSADHLGFLYDWQMHGFGFGFGPSADSDYHRASMMAPAWFIILLALLLPGQWLIRYCRNALRARVGCCPKCGYDLRGQPVDSTKCPECGRVLEKS